MAKFVGSKLQDENWGEDFFISKLIEYFDNSFIIYRNRPIFGAQFDVCLLAPKIGVIIFEVKAWKADTIKEVRNGDSIVISVPDEDTGELKEKIENPTNQARGYVYKMRRKIRQKTGKNPLVYDMVCFPNLSKAEYDAKGIEPVCEYESTILKEDLVSKAALFEKMNLCIKNHKGALKNSSEFSPDLLFRVRQIFETDINLEDQTIEDTDIVVGDDKPDKSHYSIFSYIPKGNAAQKYIDELVSEYSLGTKLYLVLESYSDLEYVRNKITKILVQKGLAVDGQNLKIDFSSDKHNIPQIKDNSFILFNCSSYLANNTDTSIEHVRIYDGTIENEMQTKALVWADKVCNFNVEQYRIEHSETKKNIIVRAGAGTGKTFTMISRIAFICYAQNCSMKEMANRIVMITFTDDAANQMEEKIKKHFNNYYLLTGDTDCLAFINQIEGMQISTIHSYAKKLIAQLGFEFGYGSELSVTSGDYKRKQIIASLVDKYIVDMQKKHGDGYLKQIGMPVYMINNYILNMLTRLHNQSIDVASLDASNFGEAITNKELHELICSIIPQAEQEYDIYLKQQNRLHLNNMMSMLEVCLSNQKNIERLIRMQTGRPQYMFVDEFQDTDDVQINALCKIATLLQYKLFVVGDVKQCIYRFRGAKENAFDQLKYRDNPAWNTYSLYKNYRTDGTLLDLFHNSFLAMGQIRVDNEQLLMYSEENPDGIKDRLLGTVSYNKDVPQKQFYKKILISEENLRIPAVFEEVERQKSLISAKDGSSKPYKGKEREIAILVRENWQAELIKKEGKKRGYEVITNTGGDLYMSEPALEMLTLANALLHYDESDYLYAFVSSNFIGGSMSKARMLSLRDSEKKSGWKKSKVTDVSQAQELQQMINRELSYSPDEKWDKWNTIVGYLRTMPVLQVVRKIYSILRPWIRYGGDSKLKQDNYRLNVDLLLEEIISTANKDSLTINSLVDILSANIVSKKNVDSRLPETDENEVVIKCITVHKAKGLEYGAVILPFCSSSINIMKRSDMNVSITQGDKIKIGYQIKNQTDTGTDVFQNDLFDESMEKNERMREEARILYVAMTRAIRSFSWIALDNKKNKCWQNLIWEE